MMQSRSQPAMMARGWQRGPPVAKSIPHKVLSGKVEAEELPARFRFAPGSAPCQTGDCHATRKAIIFDVTFVDDEAFVLTAAVPRTLLKKLKRAVALVVECFEHYGMTINCKPGKTKAIVLRGKKAKAEKAAMCDKSNNRTLVADKTRRRRIKKAPAVDLHVSINVVDCYKHLGCIVDGSGNLVPEARNREKSAMSAFAPLSTKVLGSKALSIKRRIGLAWSLVISRLVFGVHTWTEFSGQARRILNNVYMRVWRRVLGDPRFQRTAWIDAEVRNLLGVPSLDCYIRQRRLIYFSRLTRVDFDALHAVLQAKDKFGAKLPWIKMLTHDLCVLRQALPGKLAEMPDPQESLQLYWNLAKNFPVEWKRLVKLYVEAKDDPQHRKKQTCKRKAESYSMLYRCDICEDAFGSHRSLAAHRWSKHRIKSSVRQYVGDISSCPICKVEFHTRSRLIKHLSERRVRAKGRTRTCQDLFLNSSPLLIPQSDFLELEKRDALILARSRRQGHTNVISKLPSKSTEPSILKGVRRSYNDEGRQLVQMRPVATQSDARPHKRLRVKTTLSN